jgi:hypothetical protein
MTRADQRRRDEAQRRSRCGSTSSHDFYDGRTLAMAMANEVNVVLVHGGFVDGSGWEGVYRVLRKGVAGR